MSGYYSSPDTADVYCDFHYGPEHLGVPNLCREVVEFALPYASGHARALDVGCAVGRASFELARHFDDVVGIDLSDVLIERALQVATRGNAVWERVVDGPIRATERCELADLGLAATAERVRFLTLDAAAVPTLGTFDLVLACNLIDRVPDPLLVLRALSDAVAPGGCLVLASPFTWLPEHTPPENFLSTPERTSWDRLLWELADCTLLTGPRQIEFAIRETQRKFQHSFAQAGVWRKNG